MCFGFINFTPQVIIYHKLISKFLDKRGQNLSCHSNS